MQEEKIILYFSDEGAQNVDVYFADENFWLTQKSMAELFDVESNTITYHLQEIYKSQELEENRTTRNFRVVRLEGKRQVDREIMFYNLDAVISVGYRVNSKKATLFRKWATKTLQEFILKGFVLNNAAVIIARMKKKQGFFIKLCKIKCTLLSLGKQLQKSYIPEWTAKNLLWGSLLGKMHLMGKY